MSATAAPLPTPRPVAVLHFGWRILLSIVVGLAQSTCFPPIGLALLLPLSVAAFLLLLNGLSVKSAFRLGFLYGLAWFLGDLFWFTNIFGPAAISLCAILAFFIGLFAALYAWLRDRMPWAPAWLLAALLWTGIEYYRSELFVLKFGWLGLGYAIVNAPCLAVGASWFGCYGLTFATTVLAGLLSTVATPGRRMALAGCVLYGIWCVLYLIPFPAPRTTHPLRVRLVQAPSEDDESFFNLSVPSAGAPVDVIVWPEYSFVSDPTRQPKLWTRLQNVARANHSHFLFGAKEQFDTSNEAAYWNTAFLLDPDGRLVGKHIKNHTVHFFRDGAAGKEARAIPTTLGRLGVAICFDMDYPDVARRLTEDGAEVFLVPNDDPAEWGPVQRAQHRLMFQMRAVECGRWLARADVAGGTSVALPTGSELVRIHTTGPGALDASVGRLSDKTLFLRGGWRFGSLCLAVAICLVGAAILSPWISRYTRVGAT